MYLRLYMTKFLYAHVPLYFFIRLLHVMFWDRSSFSNKPKSTSAVPLSDMGMAKNHVTGSRPMSSQYLAMIAKYIFINLVIPHHIL